MSDVRESLRQLCQVELSLRDADVAYKEARGPSAVASTHSYNALSRAMGDDETPLVSLPNGHYLHYRAVNTQLSFKEDLFAAALTDALVKFRQDSGHDIAEARENLLGYIKAEVRAQRTRSNMTVTYLTKLPRALHADNAQPASTFIAETAALWADSKVALAAAHKAHVADTAATHQQRTDLLATACVGEYLRGMADGAHPVLVDGKKLSLTFKTSTRNNAIRETHVQAAMRTVVHETVATDEFAVDVSVFTARIMEEVRRLAGTETGDRFSLVERRGRKRAAE